MQSYKRALKNLHSVNCRDAGARGVYNTLSLHINDIHNAHIGSQRGRGSLTMGHGSLHAGCLLK
jgi:hypothetical protein